MAAEAVWYADALGVPARCGSLGSFSNLVECFYQKNHLNPGTVPGQIGGERCLEITMHCLMFGKSTVIECGCGVSLTGEHLLNASELKCPGCHRNLELQAVKIAVKAAVRLEASTFHCLSHKIHLIPPRFATANVTPEIAQLTSPDVCRENRYNQQKLASGEPLTDEEYLSLTR